MQRYFVDKQVDGKFVISKEDIHHIKNVMRYKNNDKIEIVYQNEVYLAIIQDISTLSLKIEKKYSEDRDIAVKLTIAISLVQEQKMDLILQKLTELGVYKIIPLITERSIVKLDDNKKEKKIARWEKICKEASEQSNRTSIPIITPIKKISDLKEEKQDIKLICSLNKDSKPINEYLNNNNNIKEILFVIGPEGGISQKEEEQLISYDFKRISLVKRVLRVETAAIYVASIINYIYKGWEVW